MSTASLDSQAMAIFSEALDEPSDQRAEWIRRACGGNEALHAKVLALLKADTGHDGLLRTGGAAADQASAPLPERVGAYRITGLIGEGGMGAVYEGRRDGADFDHVVAIKVVRPGALSEALVERFQRERRILASLNHPHIARLYDGGQTEDGAPYIVMERVDGTSITAWARQQNLSQSARLSLFSDLCDAVRHAHQHLIIHRDITPANVLVTPEGYVKLIDFGIAKPHSEDEPHSSKAAEGALSYTPGFAAPERASGTGANTLSDIFSLGKILKALSEDQPADRDLTAIIARATASDPDARYRSVDSLMDDIGNYSADRPVAARQGGSAYRFGKFLARRRLAVSFGSLAVLGLAGALIVTAIQYNRAETALQDANDRFDQARTLSRALIFDVYDSFDQIAGTLEPRKSLADLVRDYVAALELDQRAPGDVLFEVGTIQSRLSDLYGGIGVANFGDFETARQLLQEAETHLQMALAKSPDSAEVMQELIMVKRVQTMHALNYQDDSEAALAHNSEASALARRGLEIEDAEERPFLRHMWSARTDLLQIMFGEGKLDAALERLSAWRAELTPDMYERLGGGEEMGAYLAMQHAETLTAVGRYEAALAPVAETIAYRREQLDASPESYYQMTQLMVAYGHRAAAYRGMGELEQSLAAAGQAVALARKIRDADPEDAGGPEGLAKMLGSEARTHLALGDPGAAQAAAREALSLARELDRQIPGEVFYQTSLYELLGLNARIEAALGGHGEACRLVEEAASLGGSLDKEPHSPGMSGETAAGDIAAASRQAGCPA